MQCRQESLECNKLEFTIISPLAKLVLPSQTGTKGNKFHAGELANSGAPGDKRSLLKPISH